MLNIKSFFITFQLHLFTYFHVLAFNPYEPCSACSACDNCKQDVQPLSDTCFMINISNSSWYKYQMQVYPDYQSEILNVYVNGIETQFSYKNNMMQILLQDTDSYPAIVCLISSNNYRYTDLCPQGACMYSLINNFPNDCYSSGVIEYYCSSNTPNSPIPDNPSNTSNIPSPTPIPDNPSNIPSPTPIPDNPSNTPNYPIPDNPSNIPSPTPIPDNPSNTPNSPIPDNPSPNSPIPDNPSNTPNTPIPDNPSNTPNSPIPDYPSNTPTPPYFPWCRCGKQQSQMSLTNTLPLMLRGEPTNTYCFTITISNICPNITSPCCAFQLDKIEFESQLACYGSIVYSTVNGVKKPPFFQSKPGPSVKITQMNMLFDTLKTQYTEVCLTLRPPCSTIAQLCNGPTCTYALFQKIATNSCCIVGFI